MAVPSSASILIRISTNKIVLVEISQGRDVAYGFSMKTCMISTLEDRCYQIMTSPGHI